MSLDAYVKQIYFKNGVTIETDSLLFPLEREIERIDIEGGNRSYTFYNVTAISIGGHSKYTVEADSTSTQAGDGFYTRFQMNQSFSAKPMEGSVALKITAGDEDLELNDVNRLTVNIGHPIQLLARTPKIKASKATFVEFYPQGNLQSQTRTYGQNLEVTGPTEFSIMLSDTYSIITNVRLGAGSERDPPIVTFNLLSTLPTAIFWSLILLPTFIGASFLLRARKPTGKGKTTEEEKSDTGDSRQMSSESEDADNFWWS
jgi:hypothetical protein